MLIRLRYILVAMLLMVAAVVLLVYKLFRKGGTDEAFNSINDAIVSNQQWFTVHSRKSKVSPD